MPRTDPAAAVRPPATVPAGTAPPAAARPGPAPFDRALDRAWDFVSSVRLAVTLLLVLAVVLAAGTFYEASHGTPTAQRHIYKSLWFDLLLTCFAFNVICGTFRRWPFTRRHTGFLVTHVGVLTVLAGALLSRKLGEEGRLVIPEGESRTWFETDDHLVALHRIGGGAGGVTDTGEAADFEKMPGVTRPNRTVRTPWSDLRVTVTDFFAASRPAERVEEGGPGENPAVRLRLHVAAMKMDVDQWLFPRDPERRRASLGPLEVAAIELGDAAAAARWIAPEGGSAPARDPGRLLFYFEKPGVSVDLALAGVEPGKPAALEGTAFTLVIDRVFERLKIEFTDEGKLKYSEAPDGPLRPALAGTLRGEDHTQEFLAVAGVPDFDAAHGTADRPIAVKITYLRSDAAEAQAGDAPLVVAVGPGGFLGFRVRGRNGESERGALEPGAVRTAPGGGYTFQVDQVLKNGRVETVFEAVEADPNGEGNSPAIRVEVEGAGKTSGSWIPFGGAALLAAGDGMLQVEYRPRKVPLGFAVALRDFDAPKYEGTDKPRDFISDLTIDDAAGGAKFDARLQMNATLVHKGFKLFQSSYLIDGDRATTVIQVNRDPGVPVVYTGFVTLILGVFLMTFGRRWFAPPRRQNGAAAQAVPAVEART